MMRVFARTMINSLLIVQMVASESHVSSVITDTILKIDSDAFAALKNTGVFKGVRYCVNFSGKNVKDFCRLTAL